ncbi:hypothetical protein AVEN_186480-1, partial [Araneus ventricosus]
VNWTRKPPNCMPSHPFASCWMRPRPTAATPAAYLCLKPAVAVPLVRRVPSVSLAPRARGRW